MIKRERRILFWRPIDQFFHQYQILSFIYNMGFKLALQQIFAPTAWNKIEKNEQMIRFGREYASKYLYL